MKNHLLIISILTLLYSCQLKNENQDESEWKLIYQTDKEGTTKYGDKDQLIALMRRGEPLRIGWTSKRRKDTTKSVEHLVDATFITIANGNEVFAQIQPFLGQRPDLTSDTLSMTLLPNQLNWILGTNGMMSSFNIDYPQDTIFLNGPSLFKYETVWFVKTRSKPQ